MNREILFRGEDIKGNWYEGLLAHNIAKDEWYISNKAGISTAYQVRPETIGQFTGLIDKNGVKIFEGDIVRCVSRLDYANMIVVFEDGEFRMVKCEDYKTYTTGNGYFSVRCFHKEVIGNIYNNSELLNALLNA